MNNAERKFLAVQVTLLKRAIDNIGLDDYSEVARISHVDVDALKDVYKKLSNMLGVVVE